MVALFYLNLVELDIIRHGDKTLLTGILM